MAWERDNHLSLAVSTAGAAVIVTVLKNSLHDQAYESLSELICWALLPFTFCQTPIQLGPTLRDTIFNERIGLASRPSLWAAALCFVITSMYKYDFETIQTYVSVSQWPKRDWKTTGQGVSFVRSNPFLLSTGVAVVTTTALYCENSRGVTWSIIILVAQLFVFRSFFLYLKQDPASKFLLPEYNPKFSIWFLSCRTYFLFHLVLLIQCRSHWILDASIVRPFSLGVLKALSWHFIIKTALISSWCVAPAIEAFGIICTRDPFKQIDDKQALLNMIASILALSQVIYFLRKISKYIHCFWIFALIPLTPYVMNLITIKDFQYHTASSFSNGESHPVAILARNAETIFKSLVDRQSRNYTAAYNEYTQRYLNEPPDGFYEWYNYAVAHNSNIIDDFDPMYQSISPLWHLSGRQVIEVIDNSYRTTAVDLWLCEFSSSKSEIHCKHPWRKNNRHFELLFNSLVGSFGGKIGDMKFLLNHLDEPRVIFGPGPSPMTSAPSTTDINIEITSREMLWKAVVEPCIAQESTIGRSSPISPINNLSSIRAGLHFINDHYLHMHTDMCQMTEFARAHGLFRSIKPLPLLHGLVPILSSGGLSTTRDILIPSPAYIEEEFSYDESFDVDWNKKRNNMYWRGSTTGGFSDGDDQWTQFHRQRFVTLAQSLDKNMRHRYLRKGDDANEVEAYQSSFLNSRLFDASFTKITGCLPRACRVQSFYFRLSYPTDRHAPLQSRLVFDIDGNGISGRFYQLLASKSAVLKQTMFREWHTDRLVPWYHYIPVSQSMDELPELVNYLVYNKEGQRIARSIAEQGREGYRSSLREVDMRIYVWRLMLELARLQDPNREALDVRD